MKQLLFIISLFFTFSLHAQLDDLVKHWTFDKNTGSQDFYNTINSTSEVTFSDGIVEKSLSMKDKDYYIDFKEHLNVNLKFSVVFWFKTNKISDIQTLLLQEKINNENGEIKRYFQVGIFKGKLAIKDEKSTWQSYSSTDIEADKWYQLTYSYDEFELQIFLDEKKIHTSDDATIFEKMYRCYDKLYLGKAANNASSFNGYIDEVMIFDEGINKNIVADIYKIAKVEPPKEVIKTTPKIVKTQPVSRPKVLKNSLPKMTKGRTNETPDSISISVQTTDIEIEIWDYDQFDEDRIMFILNNKEHSKSIPLNKRRNSYKYKLSGNPNAPFKINDDNYLIFYATDMGRYRSQNTAGVRIWLDGKPQNDKPYKFVLTENKNAVLKISHKEEPEEEPVVEEPKEETPKPKDKTPKVKEETPEVTKEIQPNKVAKNKHELTVSDTALTISIMDNSVVDGDSVTIIYNGKEILSNHGLTKKLHVIPIELVQNQANNFTFIPVSMGSRNTQNTALVIIKAGEKVIDKVTLGSLDKNRPAKLVIVHKSKE